MRGTMNFIKKNWRLWYGLYIFIYLPWFFYLEKAITMDNANIHIMNTAVDDAIPFCVYFIVPYTLWFFYVIGACIFMLFSASDSEFKRFGLCLVIGMSLSLFTCMIYPSGLTLRPDSLPDSIFGSMVAAIYSSDTPTNVFPSIHVYNSLVVHNALHRNNWIRKHKIIDIASLILCISICLSTVLIKQHSLLDVLGAVVLMIVMYRLVYATDYNRIFRKSKTSLEAS
jgi:membrane-associated phospholipid phosphatase